MKTDHSKASNDSSPVVRTASRLAAAVLPVTLFVLSIGGMACSSEKKTEEGAAAATGSVPAATNHYVNSREGRTGSLAENFVDFSFDYPADWKLEPKADPNFVKVEKMVDEITLENFAVGWVSATGTPADKELMPKLAEQFSQQFSTQFANYKKTSEGAVKVGPYDGYEFRFTAKPNNVIDLWGLVVMVPPPAGQTKGVALVMLATNKAPELQGVNDVGKKGQLPVILNSFKFESAAPAAAASDTAAQQ